MKAQIEGWIARDEGGDLHLFTAKPCRVENRKCGRISLLSRWENAPEQKDCFLLPHKMFFQEFQWEDEPKKATMTIETGWVGRLTKGEQGLLKAFEIQKRIDSGELTEIDGLKLLLEELKEINDD